MIELLEDVEQWVDNDRLEESSEPSSKGQAGVQVPSPSHSPSSRSTINQTESLRRREPAEEPPPNIRLEFLFHISPLPHL